MTHPSDIAGLSPIDRIRLALHLSEGYDDREFECEPEYVEALLAQFDSLSARVKELEARQADDLAEFGLMEMRATRAEQQRDMLRAELDSSQTDLQNAIGDRDEADRQQIHAEQQRDEAKQSLYLAKNDADNLRDALHEATTRLQSELDTANANHRAMAAQLAHVGRERDEVYERAATAAWKAIDPSQEGIARTCAELAVNAIRRLASGPEGGAKP